MGDSEEVGCEVCSLEGCESGWEGVLGCLRGRGREWVTWVGGDVAGRDVGVVRVWWGGWMGRLGPTGMRFGFGVKRRDVRAESQLRGACGWGAGRIGAEQMGM